MKRNAGRTPFGSMIWFVSHAALFAPAFMVIALAGSIDTYIGAGGQVPGWSGSAVAVLELTLVGSIWLLIWGAPFVVSLLLALRVFAPRFPLRTRRPVVVVLVLLALVPLAVGLTFLGSGRVSDLRLAPSTMVVSVASFAAVGMIVRLPGDRPWPAELSVALGGIGLAALQFAFPVLGVAIAGGAWWLAHRRRVLEAGVLLSVGFTPWTVVLVTDSFRSDVPMSNYLAAIAGVLASVAGLFLIAWAYRRSMFWQRDT